MTNALPLAPKLQHYVDDRVIAGAVLLVADKDKVLDLEALGWSDLAAKKAMHVDDVFWIASMSKSVATAALMMLVDDGRVRVDDPEKTNMAVDHGQIRVFLVQQEGNWSSGDPNKDFGAEARKVYPKTN